MFNKIKAFGEINEVRDVKSSQRLFVFMVTKKVTRYYSDCGRGFWKKKQAITHDENCKCWQNPKFKGCMSCKYKSIRTDSNGMEHEPYNLETWQYNNCEHSESGIAVHPDFDHIRKNCEFYESKAINGTTKE